tara:strand:- start:656 stop:1609 length:954 start_codon:yes stop_codon:yes gene_type:complete
MVLKYYNKCYKGEFMQLKGSFVALVTPMQQEKFGKIEVDYSSLDKLLNYHLDNNTDGLVVLGTTGESSGLSLSEKEQIIKYTVKKINKKIPIIIGTGSNNTQDTVNNTMLAKKYGANAALIVTPYYNKPTQEGLFLHYQSIATQVDIPIILYNVPSRTACDLLPETVEKLLQYENIVAIKEAKGDLNRYSRLVDISKKAKKLSRDFFVLSGDDLTTIDLLKLGGHGVISVTANIAAKEMADLCNKVLNDDIYKAQEIQNQLLPLHNKLFIESNPIPVKWAMYKLRLIQEPILRLPLTVLSKTNQDIVFKAMQESGII